MFGRGKVLAACVTACFGLWLAGAAAAQVRIEAPRVDIPDRRPNPSVGADMTELVGGLLALRDGYDRSRRGLLCVLAYEDRNGNGQRDRGEGPRPGWTFTIADGTGATVAEGVSDKDGRFCNSRPLLPGAYSVRQTGAAGWSNTEPGAPMADFKPVMLPPDKGMTVLFGNCRGEGCARGRRDESRGETRAGPADPTPQGTGKICIEKYNDLNVNGVRDAGEPPLAGWHFTLWHWSSGNVDQGTTGADGRWCSQLDYAPLTYKATETGQANWYNTDPVGPAIKWVPVWANQTTTIQFGNRYVEPPPPPLPLQLCVEKFNDLNGDGVRQANEPGVPGMIFAIFPPTFGMLGITSVGPTDNTGKACMTIAVALNGDYDITEGFWNYFYPGWTATTPGGEMQTFYAAQGQTVTRVFGNRQNNPAPGQLCVTKYNDLNGDGARQAGEPFLPGWTFTLSSGASGVTGANGRICWTLPVGGYTVTETLQPGWTSSDPGGSVPTKTASVTAGDTVKLLFGNRQLPPAPGRICVVKFKDTNGDGVKQANEPVLPNWQFTVSGAGVSQSGSTNEQQGQWCTANLNPGTYTVTETMKPGWVSSTPGGTNPQLTATVTAGQTTTVMFGNRQLTPASGQVCIAKYNDLDGDGVRDANEPFLPGWAFPVRKPNGVPAGSITTAGATGSGCASLAPGAYIARETQKPGWTNTDPGAPFDKPFTVVSGQTVNLVFGNRQPPAPALLTVQKTKLTPGICHGSAPVQNECLFEVTVTNAGGQAYSGPLSFTDTVTGAQATVVTAPGLTCPPGPQSGAFTCTTGPVSIPAGGALTFQIKLSLMAAAPAQKNCVSLTWGSPPQTTAVACAPIYP